MTKNYITNRLKCKCKQIASSRFDIKPEIKFNKEYSIEDYQQLFFWVKTLVTFGKAVELVKAKIIKWMLPDFELASLKGTSDPIIYHEITDKNCQQILDILKKDDPCEHNTYKQHQICSTKA